MIAFISNTHCSTVLVQHHGHDNKLMQESVRYCGPLYQSVKKKTNKDLDRIHAKRRLHSHRFLKIPGYPNSDMVFKMQYRYSIGCKML